MKHLSVTSHAIERFRERLRPDLTPERAREELLRLARGAGEATWEKPWPSLRGNQRYLVIGFGVALAIKEHRHKPGKLIAVTCVTNDAFRVRR